MNQVILPGGAIGILGGGQLGRMLAMVARRWGYRVHVYTPEPDSPASHFANRTFCGEYHDRLRFEEFADSVDVVTFEFENVAVEPLAWIADRIPIRPGPDVFRTVQNRASEKEFLQRGNIPHAPFRIVHNPGELAAAVADIGLPAVLKTAGGGYDGKGQFVIRQPDDLSRAWQAVSGQKSTLEALVDLELEVSVLVARGVDGRTATFGPIENHHRHHILDWSCAPARVEADVARRADEIALEVARQLNLVGMICIEFFLDRQRRLLVNEIAPRPHNSGHLTIEGAATSQFEQQLRAVCGMPLGDFSLLRPAAMSNLLGDVWSAGPPAWDRMAAIPTAELHLYDKAEPKIGRKMGHITATADDVQTAIDRALEARVKLACNAAVQSASDRR